MDDRAGAELGACQIWGSISPTLFLIFINDIDTAVDVSVSILKKFADDTKWAMFVETAEERQTFQDGLDRLMTWSNE